MSEQKMMMTGNLGERLVAHYFRNLGHTVVESLDLYDNKKDMLIDGQTTEVKTQQMWHREDAFSVKKDQLAKCTSVDRLIFVETPSTENGNIVRMWEFPKEKREVFTKMTKDGRKMRLYPRSKAELVTIIEDEFIIEQFKKNTLSTWQGRERHG